MVDAPFLKFDDPILVEDGKLQQLLGRRAERWVVLEHELKKFYELLTAVREALGQFLGLVVLILLVE